MNGLGPVDQFAFHEKSVLLNMAKTFRFLPFLPILNSHPSIDGWRVGCGGYKLPFVRSRTELDKCPIASQKVAAEFPDQNARFPALFRIVLVNRITFLSHQEAFFSIERRSQAICEISKDRLREVPLGLRP
jgi:hypothetical protein